MPKPLQALPYTGGKSAINNGSGRWVASLLPYQKESLYVEPFCGMAGILLARPKANCEIINDLNSRLANWWLCVRDDAEALQQKLDNTPWSEELYHQAFDTIDEGSPIDRAVKYSTVLISGQMHGDGCKGFGVVYDPRAGRLSFDRDIIALRDRMRHVQILNRPAVKILKRVQDIENAIVYCDPPYRTSDTSVYSVDQQDLNEMVDTLRLQKGRVAISGYRDEWDMLGWHRHELGYKMGVLSGGKMQFSPRTEVLWTNYRPETQESLL